MAPSSEIFIDDILKKSLIFKEKRLDLIGRLHTMDAKELKVKALEENAEVEEAVEGYAYCDTKKEKCLNDCIWGIGGKASMVDIN